MKAGGLAFILKGGERLGATHPILGSLLAGYARFLMDSGRRSEARSVARASQSINQQAARQNLNGHTISVEALLVNK